MGILVRRLFVFSILFSSCFVPQETRLEPVNFIARSGLDLLEVTELNEIYVLESSRSLIKFDTEGRQKQIFRGNDVEFITSFDVHHGLYILVFSKESNRIYILDRFLVPVNQLDLVHVGLENGSAAGLTSDGFIWIYDTFKRKLFKIDFKGQILLESTDLSLHTSADLDLSYIREYQNQIFLFNSLGNIIVLDNLTNYKKTLNGFFSYPVSFSSNRMYFFEKNKCKYYALDEPIQSIQPITIDTEANLPVNGQFYIKENMLYHTDKRGVSKFVVK